LATPRIFDLNQKLINYAINNIIVPRVNRILTMFSVIMPSTKIGAVYNNGNNEHYNETIYLKELDDNTIVDYLKKYPIPLPSENDVINKLLKDNHNLKRKLKKKTPQ
jgi:hypothetical protein